jgi:hypothetical protein
LSEQFKRRRWQELIPSSIREVDDLQVNLPVFGDDIAEHLEGNRHTSQRRRKKSYCKQPWRLSLLCLGDHGTTLSVALTMNHTVLALNSAAMEF